MNYELAKELKDAGFSQDTRREPLQMSGNIAEGLSEMVSVPTLSELIEACGRITIKLWINNVGNKKECAVQLAEEGLDDILWYSTPEEAIAWLWLSSHNFTE